MSVTLSAIKRLVKEYEEIKKCPVRGISVNPLNEDNLLNDWHGCMEGDSDSKWAGVIIHFVISFTKCYPVIPPKVHLCSFLPHINVITANDGIYEVCLDMLERKSRAGTNTMKYQYWSSGYGVRSILMQLSSFLCSDQYFQDDNGSLERMHTETTEFVCTSEGCFHSFGKPYPPLPKPHDVEEAALHFPCQTFDGKAAKVLSTRIVRRKPAAKLSPCTSSLEKQNTRRRLRPQTTLGLKSKPKDDSNSILPSKPASSWNIEQQLGTTLLPNNVHVSISTVGVGGNNQKQESLTTEDMEWKTISYKMGPFGILSRDVAVLLLEYLDVKEILSLGNVSRGLTIMTDDWLLWRSLFQRRYPRSSLNPSAASPSSWRHAYILETNGLQSCMRCFHSLAGPSEDVLGMPVDYTINPKRKQFDYATSTFDVLGMSTYQEGVRTSLWGEPFSALLPYYIDADHFERGLPYLLRVAKRVVVDSSEKDKDNDNKSSEEHNSKKATKGADAASWRGSANSNKVEKGSVTASDVDNWRDTKACSSSAFSVWRGYADADKNTPSAGINCSNWRLGMNITDKDSDKNSVKDTECITIASSTDQKEEEAYSLWNPRTDPEKAFVFICRMMSTQVVLLCDNGVAASELALTGYCQLHRLLLAVIDKYPELQLMVDQRLDGFLNDPSRRTKTYTPSMGDLLVLLSVSNRISWSKISDAYLQESFDRIVLWACTNDPSLAEVTPGDESRLERYLMIQKVVVRLRYTLFHSVFLNLLCNGGGSQDALETCKDRLDMFQGRPPLYLRNAFRVAVKDILTLTTWEEYYRIARLPMPEKSHLLNLLEQSVANSLEKGYHRPDMDFERVMKGGVSRILLKGQSYTADPNLKQLSLVEQWKYSDNVYLDASCLIYDFQDMRIGIVDYNNNIYPTNSRDAAIRHSGDIIEVTSNSGKHSIDVHVKKLPANVKQLFFTVSAWSTSLESIEQPSCHLFDACADVEMCRYKLEGQDTEDNTAVIMCKLQRQSPEGRWSFETIGHVGYGRADSYDPIENDIYNLILSEKCL